MLSYRVDKGADIKAGLLSHTSDMFSSKRGFESEVCGVLGDLEN